MSILFLGCLPILHTTYYIHILPAWAVLAESVSYAKSSALLSVVYLSIILISIDSSEKSIPSSVVMNPIEVCNDISPC